MKKDDFSMLVDALKMRETILAKDQSVNKYNKYFDIMVGCAHNLIEQGRQEDLLPYLESDSISIQRDVMAGTAAVALIGAVVAVTSRKNVNYPNPCFTLG